METSTRILALSLLVGLCLMWCGPASVLAQRRGGRGSQSGAQSGGQQAGPGRGGLPSPEYDQVPFSPAREYLPRVYMGHNLQLVHSAMQSRLAEIGSRQGTGPERQGPQGQPDDTPLLAGLGMGSIYAFQVKPAEIVYHKAEHTLEAYCELSPVLDQGTEDATSKGFMVVYAPQVDNRFTYTDDRGRQVEFEEKKFREWTVAFRNFRDFPVEKAVLPSVRQESHGQEHGPAGEMIIGRFEVEPKAAEQLEESTRLLVVCGLEKPFATSETIHLQGTPEKPREYLAVHQYLHVRLLELWFYDVVTGKIFIKIRPKHS